MAVDMFMKIKGKVSGEIKGESRDSKLPDVIDIMKWTWGMSVPFDVATSMRSGRKQIQPFTFTKHIDRSSPMLVQALLTNEEITEATLTCRKPDTSGAAADFFTITFEKASIARIVRNVEHTDERFTEDVTLVFGKFTENYLPGKTTVTDDWSQGTS